MKMNLISWLTSALERIPGKEQIQELFPYLSVFALLMLGLGVVGRVVLGKRSALNHSVSSARVMRGRGTRNFCRLRGRKAKMAVVAI